MNIYLAGPISGMTEEEAYGWRYRVRDFLAGKHKVFIPDKVDFVTGTGDGDHSYLWEKDQDAGKKAALVDYMRVEWADVLFVNFTGARKVSIGTIMEIGWAKVMGKIIIVVMERGNVHDHSFVHWAAHSIVPNFVAALNLLTEWCAMLAELDSELLEEPVQPVEAPTD